MSAKYWSILFELCFGLIFITCAHAVVNVKIGVFLETDDERGQAVIEQTVSYLNKETSAANVLQLQTETRALNYSNGVHATFKVCELLSSGVSVLITRTSCETLRFTESVTRRFQVPHLVILDGYCSDVQIGPSSYTLSMRDESSFIVKAFMDLVKGLNWRDLVFFYDSSIRNAQLKSIMYVFSQRYIKSVLIRVDEFNPEFERFIWDELTHIRNSTTVRHRFLVFAKEETVITIMEKAASVYLLTKDHYWAIASYELDACVLNSRVSNFSNIITLSKTWTTENDLQTCRSHVVEYVVRKLEKMKLAEAFLSDAVMFVSKAIDTVVSSDSLQTEANLECRTNTPVAWSGGASILNALRETNNTGLCGMTSLDEIGYNQNTDYVFYSLDTKTRTNEFIYTGAWSEKGGLHFAGSIFPNTHRGFGNRTFRIATRVASPFILKEETDNGTKYSGFCWDILNELAIRLNFKYVVKEPEDGQFGTRQEDGSFTGMVGMTIRNEVDMVIGPVSINAERESVIDFTKPFMEDGIGIVMKKSKEETDKMLRMFKPLDSYVWIAVAGMVIVVGIGLYLANRFSPYSSINQTGEETDDQNGITDQDYTNKQSLKEDMWLVFASVMEQGGEKLPIAVSGRVILGVFWLFTILIVSSYTANLAAFLTVSISEKPIRTLEDLANHPTILPLAKPGSNVYSLFRSASGSVYQKIWAKLQKAPKLTENEAAYEVVKHQPYAFMTDKSQLEFLVQKDCQTYVLADEMFNTAGLGFVVPENSPLLEEFSYNIIKMQEAGLIERWKQKWWPRTDTCVDDTGPTHAASSLGLASTGGPFIIFLCMAGLAFLCLLCELAYVRLRASGVLSSHGPITRVQNGLNR